MSKATQVTPGPWEFITEDGDWKIRADGKSIMCDTSYYPWTPSEEADWTLIAEAGTVHHETGLTPRQLVEQRDLLESALSEMCEFFAPNAWGSADNRRDALNNAEAALALVKGEPK